MSVFQHILIATDFEPSALRALDTAVRIAAEGEAELTMLHVFSAPVMLPSTEGVSVVEALPDFREHGQRKLDELVAFTRTRHSNAKGLLRSGSPKSEILIAAKEIGADLIVMGTQGRRGMARVLLGSVAEHVVRNSEIPVLTIRDRE